MGIVQAQCVLRQQHQRRQRASESYCRTLGSHLLLHSVLPLHCPVSVGISKVGTGGRGNIPCLCASVCPRSLAAHPCHRHACQLASDQIGGHQRLGSLLIHCQTARLVAMGNDGCGPKAPSCVWLQSHPSDPGQISASSRCHSTHAAHR